MPEPWEVFGAQQAQQVPQQEPWQVFGAQQAQPQQAAAVEAPIGWGDVPGQAARNFIPSLGGVLHDIAQPVIHPIETATNLKNLTVGVLQKTGLMSGDDAVKYADAFGQYFKDRYGSEEGFKRAVAKDPASVLADVSAIFTGGETALARAPGMVGRAAEIAGTVGRVTDPLNVITKPVAGAIRAADVPLGALTGAGPRAVQTAREAGREGGAAAEALISQMRQTAPIEEIVTDARAAADQMRKSAQDRYVAEMAATKQNPTQLGFGDIDAALNRVDKIVTFEGRERAALKPVRDDLVKLVNEWKASDPAKFHTPAGFDELKKVIYEDVLGNIPFEQKAQRKIAGDVYDAVKRTIVKQDPQYAKTMEAYEDASRQLREIEKTLSLNPRAQVDTALRKLTSSMRNNVNTNFGRREALMQQLQQQAGAPQLGEKIAGASLSSPTPRGLASLGPTLGIGGLLTGTLPLSTLPWLAATSPRAVGEAQRAIGVAQRYGGRLRQPMGPVPITPLEALRQTGRTRNIPQFQ